jgi:hypothetical protein
MIGKSKLGLLAPVAMMGITTPAFAQKSGDWHRCEHLWLWNSPQANANAGES